MLSEDPWNLMRAAAAWATSQSAAAHAALYRAQEMGAPPEEILRLKAEADRLGRDALEAWEHVEKGG
jgi:hypothetical protein